MVGMTRAHMADPHLVRKLIAGREDDIRPCVGANYCLDRIYQGGMALCLHNPSTGREIEQPHHITKAEQKKRVTIVGAGPAGMEAARVSVERGHEVTVFEAADQPGGQIRLTALQERRREMAAIIAWRFAQCTMLGVQFHFNRFADAQDVTSTEPDDVIVATGGLAHSEVLAEGNALVVSTWDILSGDVKPGRKVLIFDDAGDHAGRQAADLISATGAAVEIVTPDRSFAPEVMGMNLVPYLRGAGLGLRRCQPETRRGSGRGQLRHPPDGRDLFRAETPIEQSGRGRLRGARHRSQPGGPCQSAGPLSPFSHRRCRLCPQYTCRDI